MKTAIITGASSGLGREFARQLTDIFPEIECCWLIARREDRLEEIAREMVGVETVCLPLDLCDSMSFTTLQEKLAAEKPEVAILINNAGIAQQKLFTDITNEDWEAMVGVNLSGVFYCCRAALPYMIRQKAGSIVNVSSMWGICGASCEVHYSAVKAGVIGLTKALAQEVGPSGIRVNCVAPGAIATHMNDNLDEEAVALLREETPLGRMGTPEEIARAIAFLALEDSAFTTGQVLSPNGGLVI